MQWLCTPPVGYSLQFENNQIITKTNIYNKKYNCSKGQFILTLSLRDDHSVVVQLVLARSKLVKQKLVAPPQKRGAEFHFFSVLSSTCRPNSVSVD